MRQACCACLHVLLLKDVGTIYMFVCCVVLVVWLQKETVLRPAKACIVCTPNNPIPQ